MRFGAPYYLWLLVLVPLFPLIGAWTSHRARRALDRFAGGREWRERFTEQIGRNRRAVKSLFLQVVLLALPIALARPQWSTRVEPVTQRGLDLAIVLDVSLSMATDDLAPSRLEQATHAVDALLGRIEGDRVALVTFAGRAELNCPLTSDHGAVGLFLDAIEVAPGTDQGTGLAGALALALKALESARRGESDRDRAIVLFSDGEDHEGGIDTVIDELKREGVAVYTVGVGTTRGAPIPIFDAEGRPTGYKKDSENRVVTSRLNEDALERVALATGGRYYRATTNEIEMDAISGALDALHRGEYGTQLRARYEDRFQIPLGLALLALTAEALLGDRRRGSRSGVELNREAR